MIHLAPADLLVIAAYLLLTVGAGLGLYGSRNSQTEEYLVAGRSVTLPAFVATLVSTWYGGILGIGEYTYTYGLANWVVFGLPYYVFALVFALVLAERVRRAQLYTIPDRLDAVYGRAPAVLGSVFAFIMVSPAPYVLMLGVLAQIVTGWPLTPCVVGGTVLSVFYVANGGLRTDIRVNVVQFALMFLGFGVILPLCLMRLGGPAYLRAHLPAGHLTWTGGNSPQVMLVWFLIAVWTLVDPGFHQRCYAAKSPAVARNGILVSILFWFAFDLLTCTAGLYARAALPHLADPKMSYPMLAELILPPVLKGLFYVGMLATVMSTVLSYTFLGAVTVGRDVVWRLRQESDEARVPHYTRAGLALTAVLAVALAIGIPSVVRLWYVLGNICVPGLLAPVLGSYLSRHRMTGRACLACMAGGFGTSLVWLLGGWLHPAGGQPQYWFGMEPMIPGLAVSFLLFLTAPRQQPAADQSPAVH